MARRTNFTIAHIREQVQLQKEKRELEESAVDPVKQKADQEKAYLKEQVVELIMSLTVKEIGAAVEFIILKKDEKVIHKLEKSNKRREKRLHKQHKKGEIIIPEITGKLLAQERLERNTHLAEENKIIAPNKSVQQKIIELKAIVADNSKIDKTPVRTYVSTATSRDTIYLQQQQRNQLKKELELLEKDLD